MKVSEQNSATNLDAYLRQVKHQTQADPAAAGQTQQPRQADSVELSQTAKDLQAAQEMVGEVSDVRAEKVAQIKTQIENGTYRVDADKTAGNLLKASLLNELL